MKIKKYFILALMLFIAGCSVKQPKIGQKAIPNEDNYIIKALLAEEDDNLTKAVEIYSFLYEKTEKPVYYTKMLGDLFFMGKYGEVVKKSDTFLEKGFNKDVFRYKILSLVSLKKYEAAKKLLLENFNKKESFFYKMMAYILLQQKKYEEASKYLKSLYAINHDKKTLLELVDILIELKKYNEALAYLRTHLDLYGCETDICSRLAIIYRQTYDYANLASIYEKMGVKNEKYLIFAFRIYIDNKEYAKALKLVEKYSLPDVYRLIVYENKNDFKKAAFWAKKLYEQTADLNYLLKYCAYLYESDPSKKTALEIIPKLKYLLAFYKTPYIYNFLGYMLINYDVDVKEGLKYVQKALEMNSQNEEYIDSLAWGYYKLGMCREAWDIIEGVKLDDKEINYHKKEIKKCLKEKNDTRKNNRAHKKRSAKNKKRN